MTERKKQMILVRLPNELADKLRATAERESRSLSMQVVYYLKRAMEDDEKP